MEGITDLLKAVAEFAWPGLFAVALFKLFDPLRSLIESARQRRFTIKVAGNELTMEEVSEQQRSLIADLQAKIALIEQGITNSQPALPSSPQATTGPAESSEQEQPHNLGESASAAVNIAGVNSIDVPGARQNVRLLWVDDQPKNNSLLVAALEEQGVRVDTALSTQEGMDSFRSQRYDAVISDMGRPEGSKAGIELLKAVRSLDETTPFYIYCGSWAARNLRDEALRAGANDITSSATTLMAKLLPAPVPILMRTAHR